MTFLPKLVADARLLPFYSKQLRQFSFHKNVTNNIKKLFMYPTSSTATTTTRSLFPPLSSSASSSSQLSSSSSSSPPSSSSSSLSSSPSSSLNPLSIFHDLNQSFTVDTSSPTSNNSSVDSFTANFKLENSDPDSIRVTVCGQMLTISAQHTYRNKDGSGYVAEINRKYSAGRCFDAQNICAVITKDSCLKIDGLLKDGDSYMPGHVYEIPINREG